MSISRLRLRFAAWSALAFLASLALLETGLVVSRRRAIDRDLSRSLQDGATDLARFLKVEIDEEPHGELASVLDQGLLEYLPHDRAALVRDQEGLLLAWRGPAELKVRLPEPAGRSDSAVVRDLPRTDGPGYRAATVPFPGLPGGGSVTLIGNTLAGEEELERFLRWLLATLPAIVLISGVGGYLLSQRAVRPIRQLGNAIRALPSASSARLLVRTDPDELDQLATHFNEMLDRLQTAQSQNRRFVQDAAHQLRTPLTLVLGEADLALAERDHTAVDETALRRVRTAAEQMKHRVEELFLLAQAESGDQPLVLADVDLEGLAFDVTDLMRGRAAGTGHRLELQRIEPATAVGNEALLKEALIELLENACRHGDSRLPVGVSAFVERGIARIEVWSGGEPMGPLTGEPSSGANRIGLRVVDWIARRHGGSLAVQSVRSGNLIGLGWPAGGKR